MKWTIVLVIYLHLSESSIKTYDFVVERKLIQPDGFQRTGLTINSLFPGPNIDAMTGDIVQVKVSNYLQMGESLTIHWHGIHQINTPWMDGAAFVTNCPIVFGTSFTYNFTLDHSGTFFYHAHVGSLNVDGVYGLIIVRDLNIIEHMPIYDDEIHMMVSDWYHESTATLTSGLEHNPFMWSGVGQSILINGKGYSRECALNGIQSTVSHVSYSDGTEQTLVRTCTGQQEIFCVEQGKTYLLRIVNTATLAYFAISIAGHNLTIVSTNGVVTEPVSVASIELSSGQRMDVLLYCNQMNQIYNIEVQTDYRGKDTTPSGISTGLLAYGVRDELGSIQYVTEKSSTIATFPFWEWNSWNEMLHMHSLELNNVENVVPKNEDVTKEIVLVVKQQYVDVSSGYGLDAPLKDPGVSNTHMAWTLYNNSRLKTPKTPYLYGSYFNFYNGSLHDNGPKSWFYDGASKPLRVELGDVVDIVIQNTVATNGICEQHPWHLHGHDFWVIGQGAGEYPGDSAKDNYNTHNPILLDTVTGYPSRYGRQRGVDASAYESGHWLEPCGWITLRFVASNPGMWLFHCHVAWHAEMGMAIVLDVASEVVSTAPPQDLPLCGDDITYDYIRHDAINRYISEMLSSKDLPTNNSSTWYQEYIILLALFIITLVILILVCCHYLYRKYGYTSALSLLRGRRDTVLQFSNLGSNGRSNISFFNMTSNIDDTITYSQDLNATELVQVDTNPNISKNQKNGTSSVVLSKVDSPFFADDYTV